MIDKLDKQIEEEAKHADSLAGKDEYVEVIPGEELDDGAQKPIDPRLEIANNREKRKEKEREEYNEEHNITPAKKDDKPFSNIHMDRQSEAS